MSPINNLSKNIQIVDYTCVYIEEVSSYLKKGWVLYGNPFFDRVRHRSLQAVVKIRKTKKIESLFLYRLFCCLK